VAPLLFDPALDTTTGSSLLPLPAGELTGA
jgi:hypothetical protein